MHISDTRLDALEAALAAAKVDLYLQPMADEFQGEYTPECAARLPYLTGFTGSAGLGAFWAKPHGARRHVLFADGRYTLQAAQQVSARMQVVNSGEVPLSKWLEESDAPVTIGFDPWLVTESQIESWKKTTAALPVTWQAMENPVDGIWKDRPAAPAGEVELQPLSLAGKSFEDKRSELLQWLGAHHADAAMLTLPDGINWLLNIRGSDIPFNPLLLAYLKIEKSGESTLYISGHTFVQSVDEYLKSQQVAVVDIASLWSGKMPMAKKGEKLVIDPAHSAHGFWVLAEKQGVELLSMDDPTLLPKAKKNSVELDGVRAAHRRDGLALSKLLCWLDERAAANKLPDELEVVAKLEECRKQANSYREPSFATIAGSGPHGAIVHYRADAASNRRLKKGDIFLLDSGGQYPDGTTDVTRTVTIGEPTTIMKDHYSRVLKGHIALATAKFPAGTSGQQLDTLARQYLWQAGLDYDHGTGHGVGAYLCVHEGPARIAKKGSPVALEVGMILSNEPGFYLEGKYGIRIENLVTVIKTGAMPNGRDMLGFETLTLAPIDTRLVEVKMLTVDERNWLNDYHRRVYSAHEAALDYEEKRWLADATRAI
jgi:Xaa-Pro aminopeptidase